MFWFMVLAGANSLNMVICLSKNEMEINYKHGRIYLISHQRRNWTDASSFCQNRTGHLATIYEPSTIPEMGFTEQNRTFWVGLQWNTAGSLSTWTNWHSPPSKSSEICGSVSLHTPFMWYAMECTIKLPFICEIRNGSCRYAEIKTSKLRGSYDAHRMQVSLKQCEQICEEGTLGFTCRSFVWNVRHNFCQFSKNKLGMSANYTLEHYENWNYYQKNCTTKVIIIEGEKSTINNTETMSILSSSSLEPWIPTSTTDYSTSSIPISWTEHPITSISESVSFSAAVTSSTARIAVPSSTFLSNSYHPITETSLYPLTSWHSTSENIQLSTSFLMPTTETSKLLYCTEICFDHTSKTLVHSSSSVFSSTSLSSSLVKINTSVVHPLAEMESMSQRIKDKAKQLKKISIEDNRPSSISIGTLSIVIIVSVLVFVVALDISTLKCHSKRKKKKRVHSITPSQGNSPYNDADSFANIYQPSFRSIKIINSKTDDNTGDKEMEMSTKF